MIRGLLRWKSEPEPWIPGQFDYRPRHDFSYVPCKSLRIGDEIMVESRDVIRTVIDVRRQGTLVDLKYAPLDAVARVKWGPPQPDENDAGVDGRMYVYARRRRQP